MTSAGALQHPFITGMVAPLEAFASPLPLNAVTPVQFVTTAPLAHITGSGYNSGSTSISAMNSIDMSNHTTPTSAGNHYLYVLSFVLRPAM